MNTDVYWCMLKYWCILVYTDLYWCILMYIEVLMYNNIIYWFIFSQVSWIRKQSLHVLTSNVITFTGDNRFVFYFCLFVCLFILDTYPPLPGTTGFSISCLFVCLFVYHLYWGQQVWHFLFCLSVCFGEKDTYPHTYLGNSFSFLH